MQTKKYKEDELSPYARGARCGWCKKLSWQHSQEELIIHFSYRDAYIGKLRAVQKMTAEDRKKLVRFIKRHTTKDERRKLFYRLRYTYDFDEFWDERKARIEKKMRRKK